MVKRNRLLQYFSLIFAFVALQGCGRGGCSGFDLDAISVDESFVDNYTKEFFENRLPEMAVAYASFSQGGSSFDSVVEARVKDIERLVMQVKKFPQEHKLDALVVTDIENAVNAHEKLLAQKIKSQLATAKNSRTSARNLAANAEAHARANSDVDSFIQKVRNVIPPASIASINPILDDVKKLSEGFYGLTSVLALRLLQKDIFSEIRNAEVALQELVEAHKQAIGSLTDAQYRGADRRLHEVKLSLSSIKETANRLVGETVVESLLVNAVTDLTAKIAVVKIDFTDLLLGPAKTDAEKIRLDLSTAGSALTTIANDAKNIEDVKTVTDPWAKTALRAQLEGGFNVLFSSSPTAITTETNVNRLSKNLVETPTPRATELDDEAESILLMQAFAAYAGLGLEAKDGFTVGSVNLIHIDRMIATAQQYTSDEATIERFVHQQLAKVRSNSQTYRPGINVFAIRPTQLPNGVSVADVVKDFLVDRIIILRPESLTDGSLNGVDTKRFAGKSLTAPEIRNLAIHKWTKLGKTKKTANFNLGYASEELAKSLRAMVGAISLDDINNLTDTLFSLLADQTNTDYAETSNTINREIAKRYKIALTTVENAGIRNETVETVENQVAKDPTFYTRYGGVTGMNHLNAIAHQLRNVPDLTTQRIDQQLDRELKDDYDAYKMKLRSALSATEYSTKIQNALSIAKKMVFESNQDLKLTLEIADDDACKEHVPKTTTWAFGFRTTTTTPSKFFTDIVSALPISLGTPDQSVLEPAQWMGTVLSAKAIRQTINVTLDPKKELPAAVINCYQTGNNRLRLQKKVTDIENDINQIEATLTLASVAETNDFTPDKIIEYAQQLDRYGSTISQDIRKDYGDFSAWDKPPKAFFKTAFFGGTYGDWADKNLAESQTMNRRIYAYTLSHIVGKIKNASIPFHNDAELYMGFGTSSLETFQAKVTPLKLVERFFAVLLIRELSSLIDTYREISAAYYSLDAKDRAVFEAGGASDFRTFIIKVRDILRSRKVEPAIGDHTTDFATMWPLIEEFIPTEVLAMLKNPAMTHPNSVAGLLGGLGAFGGGLVAGTNYVNDPGNRAAVALLFPAVVPFSPSEKEAFISQLLILKKRLQDKVRGMPVTAVPPARKVYFFDSAVAPGYLATTGNIADQKLTPIWPKLLKYAGEIEAKAARIYQYVSLYAIK